MNFSDLKLSVFLCAVGALCSFSGLAVAEVVVVLNSGEGTVSLIDKATMVETKRFPVGKEPHHMMATPDDQLLIVANAASNDLVFLDPLTGEVKRRLDKISDPYQIGFSPDKKWFVSVSLRLDRVDIYNGADFSLVKRLPAPKAPSHVGFNSDSTLAFVTLQDSDELAAFDLSLADVRRELILYIRGGGDIIQVRETRTLWKDERDYWYKAIVPMPSRVKKGLFVEMELVKPDPDLPEVRLLNAHE